MDAGAGAVNVLYGSAGGLSAAGNQFWHQDRGGINDVAEIGDIFGYSLAAGDFNRDGISDLAIGAFGESVKSSDNGAVNVLYGSATGLSAAGNQFWSQDSPGINDSAESGDDFGFALYAADFNGDDVADLAIGVFGEGVGSTLHSGAVQVLYGAVGGLAAAGNQFWSQDSPGIVDAAETEERLGYSLGGGDFDGDGFADLAIGVVFEDVGSADEAGAVNVLYGSAAGLSPAGNQLWHQDRGGIADQAEFQDDFGSALTP
jgi:disulfide bond formation protein DsbB